MTVLSKVLFIGLDSAEPNLIREWTESGELPVLRSLRDQSHWGATTTPPGFGNGVVWPSLFTGVNAAKHGRYFARQLQLGSYEADWFNEDTDFKREPLWAHASRAGRKVAVFDMVRAPLTKGLNGIQLVDWITHDRSGPTRSWPTDLASDVVSHYGTDPMGGCTEEASRDLADYIDLRDKMLARITTKTDMSIEYLKQGNWDLFMTVYADPHDIGHQCWHLHDPDYEFYDAELAEKVGNPIKQVYQAIDSQIGRILENVGPETTVIMFTGPGMGPRFTANFALDDILRRLEGRPNSQTTDRVVQLKALARRYWPRGLRKRIKSFVRPKEEAILAADRKSRKYFAVPHNSNAGAVRINLAGREPNGIVQPGAEYDELCAALIKDFEEIVNLDNGEPLVSEVVRVADRYQGEHLDKLPDLLVVWNRPGLIARVGSDKIGEVKQPFMGWRTGDHTPRGLFYARIPGLEPGELNEKVSVMDLAVTISAMLGVKLPDADGEPILDFEVPELRQQTPA